VFGNGKALATQIKLLALAEKDFDGSRKSYSSKWCVLWCGVYLVNKLYIDICTNKQMTIYIRVDYVFLF